MMTTHASKLFPAFIGLLALQSQVLHAETDARDTQQSIQFSGSVSLVNDYIWRGQSQTWGDPALQIGLEAKHESGLYAGFWASNVSSQWVPGAYLETDWYAGFRGNLSGDAEAIGYDLNLLYVHYPSSNFDQTGFGLPASSPNSVEVSASLSYGPVSLKAGRMLTQFYGWNSINSGVSAFAGNSSAGVTGSTRGSHFFEVNLNYELVENWTLNGQAGHQVINHSTGLDWSYYKLGVTHTMGAWSGALAYSCSSNPGAYRNFLGLKNNGQTYDDAQSRWIATLTYAF